MLPVFHCRLVVVGGDLYGWVRPGWSRVGGAIDGAELRARLNGRGLMGGDYCPGLLWPCGPRI